MTGRDHFATYLRDARSLHFQVVRDGVMVGHAVSSPGVLERVVEFGGVQETARVVGDRGKTVGTVTYYLTYDTVNSSSSVEDTSCGKKTPVGFLQSICN